MKKSIILQALQHLGQLAQAEGIRLEVSIYGGAAFLLAYNTRQANKAIDALLHPKEVGQPMGEQGASKLDLPGEWPNSDGASFV